MVVTWARLLDKVEILKRRKQRTRVLKCTQDPKRRPMRLSWFRKKNYFLNQFWKEKVRSDKRKPDSLLFLPVGGPQWQQMGPYNLCPNPLTWIFLQPLVPLVPETEGITGVQLPELPTRLPKSTWKNSDQKSLITVPTWCLFPEDQKCLCLFPYQPSARLCGGVGRKAPPSGASRQPPEITVEGAHVWRPTVLPYVIYPQNNLG